MIDHFRHQFLEGGGGGPTQLGVGGSGIAQQGFHFSGPEIARVDAHHHIPGVSTPPHFITALSLPGDARPAEGLGAEFDEGAHRFLPAGGDHEVFRFVLLEHAPLHFHVVAGVTPVALGIEVAHVEALVEAGGDSG